MSLEQNDNVWGPEVWDNQYIRQVMRMLMVDDYPCFIESAPDIFEHNPAAQAVIEATRAAGRKPRYWLRNLSEEWDIAQVP